LDQPDRNAPAGLIGLLTQMRAAAGADAPRTGLPASNAAALCDLADAQGMLPLLAESLRAGTDLLTTEAAAVVRTRASQAAGADVIREVELRRLVAAFGAAGIPPLLMKGAHLAYACYSRPDLRPRIDTDLLIAPLQREGAHAVLTGLGYGAVPQLASDLIMYQAPYALRRGGAIVHLVDVHWRISNAQRFGSVLAWDELRRDAEPLPSLGPEALGLGRVHALLLACVHRVAHHRDATRLIWSYDIHLLAAGFDGAAWERLVTLSEERGVAAACLRGLDVATGAFGTPVPAAVRERLGAAAAAEGGLPAYAASGGRHITRVWSDMRAMRSWSGAVRLARQHLLPPARYMRDVYAPESSAPLPALYVRRAWRGARRWLARS
jgi:hypothetical protein